MPKAIIAPYSINQKGASVLGDVPILSAIPKALLYWDGLSIPQAFPGSMPSLDKALEGLASLGALDPWVCGDGTINGSLQPNIAAMLAMLESKGQTGDEWTYIDPTGETDFSILAGLAPQKTTLQNKRASLELHLADSLPTPPHNVAYEDILTFRSKRAAELKALRDELIFLSASLMGIESIEEAEAIGVTRVSAALADIDKAMMEKWPHRLFTSLKSKTGAMTVGAGIGAIGAAAVSFPVLLGAAAVGAAAPALEAVWDSVTGKPTFPERNVPYLYAFEASRMLNPR